jgi:hypothetical protein
MVRREGLAPPMELLIRGLKRPNRSLLREPTHIKNGGVCRDRTDFSCSSDKRENYLHQNPVTKWSSGSDLHRLHSRYKGDVHLYELQERKMAV